MIMSGEQPIGDARLLAALDLHGVGIDTAPKIKTTLVARAKDWGARAAQDRILAAAKKSGDHEDRVASREEETAREQARLWGWRECVLALEGHGDIDAAAYLRNRMAPPHEVYVGNELTNERTA